jgi:hypothetical protein
MSGKLQFAEERRECRLNDKLKFVEHCSTHRINGSSGNVPPRMSRDDTPNQFSKIVA